jgi:hypothetical protein
MQVVGIMGRALRERECRVFFFEGLAFSGNSQPSRAGQLIYALLVDSLDKSIVKTRDSTFINSGPLDVDAGYRES